MQHVRFGRTGLKVSQLCLGTMTFGYQCDEETSFAIELGDCVLLYSDGVVEAQNADGEDFGDERLLAIARASLDQPSAMIVDAIIDAIDRFVGDVPQFDDITVLVLRRNLDDARHK